MSVATSTSSTLAGSAPAAASARRPASAASSVSDAPSAAFRRSRIPVRSTIHSGETPMRSAISSLRTRSGGSTAATEAMPATPGIFTAGARGLVSISAVPMDSWYRA